MERHRLPEKPVHPIDAKCSAEIRFPTGSHCHNLRARKEDER